MTDVVVRLALVEDAEGFVRAHELAWDATLGPIVGRSLGDLAPLEERVERYRSGLAKPLPGVGAWVADREGDIVGVALRIGSELRDLYVVPAAWGTGVAAALMQAAVDAIRTDGAPEASLWVGEENARARRFYEREGWEDSGETRASQLGPTEVRYRLQLSR